jgi:hypothetical protein
MYHAYSSLQNAVYSSVYAEYDLLDWVYEDYYNEYVPHYVGNSAMSTAGFTPNMRYEVNFHQADSDTLVAKTVDFFVGAVAEMDITVSSVFAVRGDYVTFKYSRYGGDMFYVDWVGLVTRGQVIIINCYCSHLSSVQVL